MKYMTRSLLTTCALILFLVLVMTASWAASNVSNHLLNVHVAQSPARTPEGSPTIPSFPSPGERP